MQRDGFDLEDQFSAGSKSLLDQILDDFLLAVDRNRFSTGEPGQVDPVSSASEPQLDAVMDETFLL